jgi:hypothetical protein
MFVIVAYYIVIAVILGNGAAKETPKQDWSVTQNHGTRDIPKE